MKLAWRPHTFLLSVAKVFIIVFRTRIHLFIAGFYFLPTLAYPATSFFANGSGGILTSTVVNAILFFLGGGLFGFFLSRFTKTRQHRHLEQRTEAIEKAYRSAYARAEEIARFGTYEIHLAPNGAQEISHWSDAMYRMLGRSCQDSTLSTDQYILTYVSPEDRDRLRALVKGALDSNASVATEYDICCKDGRTKRVYDRFEFAGAVMGRRVFLGQVYDITRLRPPQNASHTWHDKSRNMATMLAKARECERKRLAREMHDEVGQLLAAIKMDLCNLQRCLPNDNIKVSERIEGVQELLATMANAVRRIIANLPPKSLEDLDLPNAVLSMVKDFEARHAIAGRVHTRVKNPVMDLSVASAAYRMVQEALNNVAAHAKATRVDIHLDESGRNLIISIVDNGIGLQADTAAKAGSFGLSGMHERAALLDGELKIDSQPGMGTTIRITIPKTKIEVDEMHAWNQVELAALPGSSGPMQFGHDI